MKILLVELFETYTFSIVSRKLSDIGHDVTTKKYYTPDDLYSDGLIDEMLDADIGKGLYEAVFSVNIWPPVARACHRAEIPYVAWSYDSPLNLDRDDDLSYDTNYLFLFDRVEAESYRKRGIDRVFHMPLATDSGLWDTVKPDSAEYEVSLVGSLYDSTLPNIMTALDDYSRGFIKALIAAQQKIYGYYMIDEMLDDRIMDRINACLEDIALSVSQLSYSIATYLTFLDRLTLLQLLGVRADTHLFSGMVRDEISLLLENVKIHGWVDYSTKMPAVFKASKININPALRSIRSGIPLRCLDVMGCCGFLLSSYQPELAECFEVGKELILYDSYEDAVTKASYYLEHDDEREKIAIAGYNRVKADFSYEKRLSEIFKTVKSN